MTPTLETIEAAIDRLSLTDQLTLMERLATRIRTRALPTAVGSECDLEAMAGDPAIQRELRQILSEFSVTDADGLGRD